MSRHILVVGAGVVGLSTAYYAAGKGHRVTVIDRGSPLSQGCSFGNAGMVVPSHLVPLAAPGVVGQALRWMADEESPFYVRPRLSPDFIGWSLRFWRSATAAHVERAAPLLRDLHLSSRACYEEWASHWGLDFGLRRNGLLMLCRTEEGLEVEAKAARRALDLGVPAEVLDAKATRACEPAIRMDVRGSVFYPRDCHLDPSRLMSALQTKIAGTGVRLSWSTEVFRGLTAGGRVVALRTSAGDLEADEYVICAGAWSAGLARGLGLALPLEAGKGYSLTIPNARPLPERCAILSEAHVAVTPVRGSLRFAGTMELSGMDASIDPARIRGIVKSALRYFPELRLEDFTGVEPWCGLRPCSPDGLPYLGRSARFSNLTVATGHAMMGVSLGPVTGKLVAEILSDETPHVDIRMLDPERYC